MSSTIARVLVLSLALGAAACGKKGDAPKGPAEEATLKIVAFRDQACACADVACSQKVKQEMTAWVMKESGELGKLKFTDAQNARGDQASKEMDACITKLEKADREAAAKKAGIPVPTDPPPAPAADPTAPPAPAPKTTP